MDDKTLRQSIIDELDFEPAIDAADIGVAVENGVVTLTGHVESYAEKIAAETAVKRVKGVHGIAQAIEVRLPFGAQTSDDQIAQRALSLLAWNGNIPKDAIQVEVSKGWLTLTGEVDWYFQKTSAESALRRLNGVTGISNQITLRSTVQAGDVRQRIEQALKRNAEVEAKNIQVSVVDGKVVLSGKVKAWHERDLAERAAWAAKGVKVVEDHLRLA